MKDYTPRYVGTVTKYVFVESPDMTPSDLAIRAYEISQGVMIKETCFGLQVTGSQEEVDRIIARLREFDPSHIFVKDRGFPPGDPRRCRANLGGVPPPVRQETPMPTLLGCIADDFTGATDLAGLLARSGVPACAPSIPAPAPSSMASSTRPSKIS